jgi:hypothetical protein
MGWRTLAGAPFKEGGASRGRRGSQRATFRRSSRRRWPGGKARTALHCAARVRDAGGRSRRERARGRGDASVPVIDSVSSIPATTAAGLDAAASANGAWALLPVAPHGCVRSDRHGANGRCSAANFNDAPVRARRGPRCAALPAAWRRRARAGQRRARRSARRQHTTRFEPSLSAGARPNARRVWQRG